MIRICVVKRHKENASQHLPLSVHSLKDNPYGTSMTPTCPYGTECKKIMFKRHLFNNDFLSSQKIDKIFPYLVYLKKLNKYIFRIFVDFIFKSPNDDVMIKSNSTPLVLRNWFTKGGN